MENRYYVKLYWSHTGNLSKQEVSFMVEADSKEKAKDIATEDYIWDEAQTAPDTYGVHFNIEEDVND